MHFFFKWNPVASHLGTLSQLFVEKHQEPIVLLYNYSSEFLLSYQHYLLTHRGLITFHHCSQFIIIYLHGWSQISPPFWYFWLFTMKRSTRNLISARVCYTVHPWINSTTTFNLSFIKPKFPREILSIFHNGWKKQVSWRTVNFSYFLSTFVYCILFPQSKSNHSPFLEIQF